jgi:hypothetical protein
MAATGTPVDVASNGSSSSCRFAPFCNWWLFRNTASAPSRPGECPPCPSRASEEFQGFQEVHNLRFNRSQPNAKGVSANTLKECADNCRNNADCIVFQHWGGQCFHRTNGFARTATGNEPLGSGFAVASIGSHTEGRVFIKLQAP